MELQLLRALTRTLSSPGLSLCPYSPECVEGKFCELRLYGVLGSSMTGGVRSVLRKRTGGAQRAGFSRWASAKHQDRHDEGRARRHVVLGGHHRGAADIP